MGQITTVCSVVGLLGGALFTCHMLVYNAHIYLKEKRTVGYTKVPGSDDLQIPYQEAVENPQKTSDEGYARNSISDDERELSSNSATTASSFSMSHLKDAIKLGGVRRLNEIIPADQEGEIWPSIRLLLVGIAICFVAKRCYHVFLKAKRSMCEASQPR